MSREREEELRTVLRQSRHEAFGVALEGLVSIELERVKNSLIDAQDDRQVRTLQGEGAAFKKILKYLTAPISSSKV